MSKYQLSYCNIAKKITNRRYYDYFTRLSLKARSIFKWENLPNNIDEKWIENYLFYNGKCLFFEDKEKGFMITDLSETGKLNYYDEPTTIKPYASNYTYNDDDLMNNEDAIIIRNNDDNTPTAWSIEIFAYKLTNIDRTIDTNIELHKIPYIITTTDKQKLSFKKLMDKKQDNEPVIFTDKDLDIDNIKILETKVPPVFKELQEQKHEVFNECNTFLGINNANVSKRERLITNEVDANNDDIEANLDVMLKARQEAVKRINKLFKLDIKVSRRETDEINEIEEDTENGA